VGDWRSGRAEGAAALRFDFADAAVFPDDEGEVEEEG